MGKLDLLFNRKSVRHFKKEGEIPAKDLEMMVKAGMAAPSAMNRQPWEFFIITERVLLDLLADRLPYAKMLYDAKAAIIVCGNKNRNAPERPDDYWVQDCSAATQNILLAAEEMEYGAVWTAAYPVKERVITVVNALHLPTHFVPLNVIPVGIPSGEDKIKDKWDPQKVHWGEWE